MAAMILFPDAAMERQMSLILPTASEVAKYAPAAAPEDDFLMEDKRGLPCVRRPVGIKEDGPSPGWFNRQAEAVSKEVAEWPAWMRQAAGLSPPDNPPDPDGEPDTEDEP